MLKVERLERQVI